MEYRVSYVNGNQRLLVADSDKELREYLDSPEQVAKYGDWDSFQYVIRRYQACNKNQDYDSERFEDFDECARYARANGFTHVYDDIADAHELV
jgi:hypothetical protein